MSVENEEDAEKMILDNQAGHVGMQELAAKKIFAEGGGDGQYDDGFFPQIGVKDKRIIFSFSLEDGIVNVQAAVRVQQGDGLAQGQRGILTEADKGGLPKPFELLPDGPGQAISYFDCIGGVLEVFLYIVEPPDMQVFADLKMGVNIRAAALGKFA